jgi:hypothetical protein
MLPRLLLQRSQSPIGVLSFLLPSSQALPSRTRGIDLCGSSEYRLTSWERELPSSLLDLGGIWIVDCVGLVHLRTERQERCPYSHAKKSASDEGTQSEKELLLIISQFIESWQRIK